MTKTRAVLLVSVSAFFFSSCGIFYDKTVTTSGTQYEQTVITFDKRLPDAVTEVFTTCHEPLWLTPSSVDLNLGGTCTRIGDLTSKRLSLFVFF